ncbi:MAG: TetR/AcrR family transcriptional regulator [Candidatus Eisenbacteria sp.]|nr:TetR/AcrR family transcriptional regulator [Candidatus Eisenbacteria bacterium]
METRELILTTAQKLFARFGVNKTTVDEIAAAAHMAKSTLYHHFRSKLDIFRAVIEREGQTLARRISAAVAAAASPEDQMRAYIVTRMRHLGELTNFYSALKEEYLEHYSFIERVRERDFKDEMTILRRILAEGNRKGTFRFQDGDIEITAVAVITALKGLEYPWIEAANMPDSTQHAEVLLRLLFHGILAEEPA